MKKNESSPYATTRGGYIKAPNKPMGQPKATIIKSNKDLRGRGK